MSTWYTQDERGTTLLLTVRPKARKNTVGPIAAERLRVSVTAPAEGGKANETVIRLLAEAFGVGRQQVRILMGASSRKKTARVEAVCDRLVLEGLEKGEGR